MFAFEFSNISKYLKGAFSSLKLLHAPYKRESTPPVSSLLKIDYNSPY